MKITIGSVLGIVKQDKTLSKPTFAIVFLEAQIRILERALARENSGKENVIFRYLGFSCSFNLSRFAAMVSLFVIILFYLIFLHRSSYSVHFVVLIFLILIYFFCANRKKEKHYAFPRCIFS